jgi:transposase-like protein
MEPEADHERGQFAQEFKVETVRLIQEGVVRVPQASRDLGMYGSVLRRWVQECTADSQQAFPSQGPMKLSIRYSSNRFVVKSSS